MSKLTFDNKQVRVASRMFAALVASLFILTANAHAIPVKLVLSAHIKHEFALPHGVAVAPSGNIYVTDFQNRRVQELTPTGQFVLMFGKEVDETTGGNVCTAISGDKCKAGVKGTGPTAFREVFSVAVDQATENVYVSDRENDRVQEFSSSGVFKLMFGKDVNSATNGNVCTAAEEANCQAGIESAPGTSEEAAFRFGPGLGNLLAIGDAKGVVYVGDEHRVQEFGTNTGVWKGEIPLENAVPNTFVQAVTLDPKTNDLYVAYGAQPFEANEIFVFDEQGKQLRRFAMEPLSTGAEISIEAMAIDPSGRLAAIADEGGQMFGRLYDSATAEQITEIRSPTFITGADFNAGGELYAAAEIGEVLVYKPVPVAELKTAAGVCKSEAPVETSVTFECTFKGSVNPDEVNGTTAWFQWGAGVLDNETVKQQIATGNVAVPVEATVPGLKPNETYNYRVDGEDEHVVAPELLTSKAETITTPTVPAAIVGVPHAEFVTSSSAVLYGIVNPEHDKTEYGFEYGPCLENTASRCGTSPYIAKTSNTESSAYGLLEAAEEASGLQPGTVYHYRLSAVNGKGEPTTGPEGQFATTQTPGPQAITGSAGAIGVTSATVFGAVNPDGQPAVYVFELGVYAGNETEYGIVASGSVGASTALVEEVLTLSGLQPGTQYAYRIAVTSGYGHAQGAPALFTTGSIPTVLSAPPPSELVGVPKINFPDAHVRACKKGYSRNKKGKCVKTKRKTRRGQKRHK